MTNQGSCPDEIELCDLARGTISADRGAVLRDHIGDCDACRTAVAALASIAPEASPAEAENPVADSARYELERLIATGGMGEVFLARDKVLEREVAIKLLHEDTSSAELLSRSRKRLLREAQALASLTHPNIVAVYDHGILDGRAFLAMEYVRGKTLRQWLAEKKPDASERTNVLVQAGRGLLAAHEMGIVHGDFKPDNVLVGDDGRARVTDFGLARTSTADQATEADAAISGTPAYMAPEQLAGAPGDAQSDQYAFCITLYEAIHGTRPPPNPGGLDKTMARGLAVGPADRFPSMRELLAELERSASPQRAGKKRRLLVVGLAAALLATSFGAWMLAQKRSGIASAAPPGLHSPCLSPSGACASPLVCRYPEGNYCGASGAPGVCGWPIDGCDAKSPEACGCNGVTFKNQCEAHRQGVGVAYAGVCRKCTGAAPCAAVNAGGKRTPAFCHVESAPSGVCWPRPSACKAGGEAMCGIDGRSYESTCEARRSGSDVDHPGTCSSEPSNPSVVPGGLTIGAPDEQHMAARPLMSLAEWIAKEKLPIFSILISRNGVLVYELYTSSLVRDDAHYLMGATGAFTSALMGVAIDRHLVGGPETSIADALPAGVFPANGGRERFRNVTIRDVLGMSALNAPVPPHDKSEPAKARFQQYLVAPNRTKFALTQEPLERPGASYQFTDITPQIASGIIEYATNMSALEFAEESLFRPMDFRNYEWMHQDATGIDNGAYGLRVRPIDMQKFGLLYLRQGAWGQKQLLSSDWALRSFSPWVKTAPGMTEPNYGWYWWAIDYGQSGQRGWIAHVASGWKGQKIAVFADQGLVVTMTGVIEPPHDEAAIFRKIVREYIAPSIEQAPDAGMRKPLAELLERVRNQPLQLRPDLESRLVPSVEPKERHHAFHPN